MLVNNTGLSKACKTKILSYVVIGEVPKSSHPDIRCNEDTYCVVDLRCSEVMVH